MCDELEKMRNEVAEAVAKRAEKARSIQIARTLRADGRLTDEDIASYTGLTLDEVKSLDTRQPA